MWSIDVCWDDSLLAVGTEVGSIELYSIKKILQRAEQQLHGDQRGALDQPRTTAQSASANAGNAATAGAQPAGSQHQILTKASHPAFVRCYQTKGSGV